MRRFARRRKIVVMRAIGAWLCIVSLAASYYWFYVLGPLRRVVDPEWCRLHSQVAYCEECQRCIDRLGWCYHDAGFAVGGYGDKATLQRIVERLRAGDRIDCWGNHKDVAFQKMTNQDAGQSAADWLAWWKENKTKTQVEWIRDGFRKHGLDLSSPLTPSDIVDLLTTINSAYGEEGEEGEGKVPSYLSYNAFRWLRDSDFDPTTLRVDDIPKKNADAVLRGLVRYSRSLGSSPKSDGLGVLDIGEACPDAASYAPRISTAGAQSVALLMVLVPLCAGVVLIAMSLRSP